MSTRISKLAHPLFFTALGVIGCEEQDDGPVVETPSEFEIEGVGVIQYGTDMRVVATVTLPETGAVHFFESNAEEGHGCAGFFPGDAPGDPAVRISGRDGCLPTFLELTAPDTPIPAALLVGSEDYVDTVDRDVVDVVGQVVSPPDLPLTAELHPFADEVHGTQGHDSCGSSGGSTTHWTNVHCDGDEFGADHCDPTVNGGITISSGATYRGSYMTGLFCEHNGGQTTHFYWNGSSWVSTVEFNHDGVSTYNFFSRWSGAASWRRRITTTEDGSGQFRHYTVMCPGLVCADGF